VCFKEVLRNAFQIFIFPQMLRKMESLRFTVDPSILLTFYSAIPDSSSDKCVAEAIRDSFCQCLSHRPVSRIFSMSYCQNFDLSCCGMHD
jgi:hypothetical protein